jgi:hypothetical protein
MLHIVMWVWGTKYGPEYLDRLRKGVDRNLQESHRWLVARPVPEDEHLTEIPGCFVRLRMFDVEWQRANGIEDGDRIVCVDLDVVITGSLDPLFLRPERFLILLGVNASNPCPYNGSLWMFRAGYRPDVWLDFSIEAASAVEHYEFPDDQAWLAHKLPGAPGWKAGAQSGVYAFKKPGWPKGEDLPDDARMVVFPGWRDPAKFAHLGWVKRHWLCA